MKGGSEAARAPRRERERGGPRLENAMWSDRQQESEPRSKFPGTPPCRTAASRTCPRGVAIRAWPHLPGSSSTSRMKSTCTRCRSDPRRPCSDRDGRNRHGRILRRRILRAEESVAGQLSQEGQEGVMAANADHGRWKEREELAEIGMHRARVRNGGKGKEKLAFWRVSLPIKVLQVPIVGIVPVLVEGILAVWQISLTVETCGKSGRVGEGKLGEAVAKNDDPRTIVVPPVGPEACPPGYQDVSARGASLERSSSAEERRTIFREATGVPAGGIVSCKRQRVSARLPSERRRTHITHLGDPGHQARARWHRI